MKAAIFKGNGILDIEEIKKPEIKKPNDVLIKIRAASVCGSDLHGLAIPPGQVFTPNIVYGHEFCGDIEAIGEAVTQFSVGDYVVVDPTKACGVCNACRTGHYNLCDNTDVYGQKTHGGFAEYVVVDEAQVYHLPDAIPPRYAAQTEPLACVMNGISKIHPTPDKKVLLFGAGPIGLSMNRAIQTYGVKHLAVVEPAPYRREYAKKCGAEFVIDPDKEDIEAVLMEKWGSKCDIAIDAVGDGIVLQTALELINGAGEMLIIGQNVKAVSEVHPATIVRYELTIKGMFSTHDTFPKSIAMLQDPSLDLDRFITHKVSLDELPGAIEDLRKKEGCRAIVYPNGFED